MENAESLFSGLSDSLKANFIPIVVVLVLVLFILGWLVYNSFTGSSSKNNDTKPEEVEVEQPTQVVEQHEQSEQADEDEKSSE
jgi:flagellar basal body-associated protein FliL